MRRKNCSKKGNYMLLNKKDALVLLLFFAGGLCAGFLNGFLGAGGGIILMYLLNSRSRGGSEASVRDNFASVVAIVMIISIVSAVSYSKRGAVNVEALIPVVIPGMIGGVIGAWLTDRLNVRLLKIVFGVILIIGGINMIWA